MPLLCFSLRKPHLVLYGPRRGSDAAALLDRPETFKSEGGCIYVKMLHDIDLAVLEALLAKNVGRGTAACRASVNPLAMLDFD